MSDQLAIDFDSPQGLTALESRVLALIQRGREHSITMQTLAATVGITTRAVQDLIAHLIIDHQILIASGCGKKHGYWLPTNEDELMAARAQLVHRIIALARRLRAIDSQAFEDIFGQTTFEDIKQ